MTTKIRRIKNKDGYFGLFQYVGTELKPLVIHNSYEFLVEFCKHEGYTWYFNLSEGKAIEIV
jgi:hypothetical protein